MTKHKNKRANKPFHTLKPHIGISAVVLVLIGIVIVAGMCSDEEQRKEKVRVQMVVDGDTIKLVDGRKVRYIGINAPEIHGKSQCYGREATEYNQQLVAGKEVLLEYDVERFDKYGRTLAYVWLRSQPARMVNYELVYYGYAKVMTIPPNTKYEEKLKEAQNHAQSENAGLWGQCK